MANDPNPWYRTALLGLCAALCGACHALPAGQQADAVMRGHQFALIRCTDCHVVAPDQNFPPTMNVGAPGFVQIANRGHPSERSLEKFIRRTHWDGQTIPITMPAQRLTQQETSDVARYILSLRQDLR